MPAISNLLRTGSALACAFRIGPRPIAADDFNPEMSLEPLCHCFSFPVWEKVNRAMVLQVNKKSAVALPSPGPVVLWQDSHASLCGHASASEGEVVGRVGLIRH